MTERLTTRYLSNLRRWFRSEPSPVSERSGHVGASEEWGVKLHEMRNAPVDPALVSDTEADLNWAQAWHDFERSMLDEVDRVFAPILAALPVADDFDEVREQTCPRELMPA